jgi:hypothetical protein
MAPITIGRGAIMIALLLGLASPGKTDTVDDYITGQMQRLHIPGVSVAIVRDGRITKAQGYGFSNLELKTPATNGKMINLRTGRFFCPRSLFQQEAFFPQSKTWRNGMWRFTPKNS